MAKQSRGRKVTDQDGDYAAAISLKQGRERDGTRRRRVAQGSGGGDFDPAMVVLDF